MANLRLFLAVEIEPAVLDRLEEAQRALKPDYPKLRWLHREGMHLTLKFLGGIPEERLAAMEDVVTPLVAGTPACTVELTGLAAFPSWRRVNVVVAECSSPPPLADLYGKLQPAFTAFDVPAEARPFRPHITLARPSHRRPEPMTPADLRFAGVSWPVHELVLFQSLPGPRGAAYKALQRWEFGG
jgi:2'-5' RNA ligase